MAAQYDEAPEVAPQNYPEVTHQLHNGAQPYGYQQPYQHPKPEGYDGATQASTAATSSPYPAAASPYSQHAMVGQDASTKRSKGVLCGCSLLVFILSCIIALLSAAVIGLAAGTGIEANRASDATNKLAALSASISSAAATKTSTSTATAPTATSFNDLDRGCSKDPDGVSGSKYTSFPFLGSEQFTIYCNRDAPGTPLLSLFASDMDTCLDACSSYSMYTPRFFGSNHNTTCGGVSFVPLWTNKTVAENGTAPGNCYLKPAPQNFTGLSLQPYYEVHAAILTG